MDNAILDAAREIGPAIAARSAEIEQNRNLPADIVDTMRATGAFRMLVPSDLGGPALSAWANLEVIEEFAYHDGAAGWCTMIGSTTSLLASFLPDPFAEQVYGDADSITGGFAMPQGRATPVEGGLRVSGRWAWGSGTQHANWIGGGCLIVDENGDPKPREDGLIVPFVFFAADDVEFIDTWHVTGLCGTGSGDYQVSDVFVPEGRWVQMGGDPVRANPLSRFSFYGLLASGVAACAIGIGRRAIDELVELAQDKLPQGSSRPLARRATIQSEVAEAEAELGAAWAFMRQATADTWATATEGRAPTIEQKRQIRLAATHATKVAARVAEAMYKAGGGAAVYDTSPLQRTFRDAHVATQHAMVASRNFEIHGRLRLGVETDTSLL